MATITDTKRLLNDNIELVGKAMKDYKKVWTDLRRDGVDAGTTNTLLVSKGKAVRAAVDELLKV